MRTTQFVSIAALAAVTLYLALSGGGPATVRSYVMAAIVFGAIQIVITARARSQAARTGARRPTRSGFEGSTGANAAAVTLAGIPACA